MNRLLTTDAQSYGLQTCCHRANPAAAELAWSHDMAHGSLSSLDHQEQRSRFQVQAENKHHKLKIILENESQPVARSHKSFTSQTTLFP